MLCKMQLLENGDEFRIAEIQFLTGAVPLSPLWMGLASIPLKRRLSSPSQQEQNLFLLGLCLG